MEIQTRRLLLKGLYNARDLGGFPTSDGRATRFGVFVRSEAPCDLCREDMEYLRDYGVTDSIDFRGAGEKASRPSDLRETMSYHEKPLFNEAVVYDKEKRPPAPPKGGGGPHDWGEQYKQMAEESRQWAIDVLNIAAACPGALLYHCTTGKDRTGLMTCYLLSIAGVSRLDIAADYCVSQVYLEPVYAKIRSGGVKMGPPPGEDGDKPGAPGGAPFGDEAFFKTPATAMLTLIDYLTEKYGGVTQYLTYIGVSAKTMETIRKKLVV